MSSTDASCSLQPFQFSEEQPVDRHKEIDFSSYVMTGSQRASHRIL